MSSDKNNETDKKDSRAEQKRSADDCFVVGIGASAGGLKALEGFFKNMPDDPGMAFVVVQHLDPKHQSHMPEILKRSSSLELSHIEDGEELAPNRVYFKPSGKDLAVENRRLKLVEPKENKVIRAGIDMFFRSMAADLGEKAIGVILSGAGSDGSLGLKEIKGRGGLAVVQEEQQADYESMPRSAIDTGMIDFILPVEKMGEKLVAYAGHPLVEQHHFEIDEDTRAEQTLKTILRHVRSRTGCDFSKYKRNTLRRRIARRMAAHQIDHIGEYERYVRDNAQEADQLFKDMLINVTSFFRDDGVFESLFENAVDDLVSNAHTGDVLRVWVPGCATGEEAYTLAILFSEAMEKREKHVPIKVFATDINLEAVEKAREGVYPSNIAADVSDSRLKRFFVDTEGGYKVEASLREKVIFAVHDITREPPFSRIDMVSCRNLLIYMEAELQKKVLPILHYSLKPGGYMLLGTSESIGNYQDLFDTVDQKYKIFRRREDGSHHYLQVFDVPIDEKAAEKRAEQSAAGQDNAQDEDKKDSKPQPVSIEHVLEQVIPHLDPPALIVDGDDQVVYFMGNTNPFLVPPLGRASFDVRRMIKEDLQYSLLRGLDAVRATKRPERAKGVRLRYNGRYAEIDIGITPIKRNSNYLMISFEGLERKRLEEEAEPPAEGDERSRVDYLEHKLNATRQELQATIEELETSNEELKSANEELQANNEELQSTNEELESSKEELQSTNEELETTNQELHRKNDEISRAEDDIKNLFASSHVGVLFLDEKLKINRFTPTAASIFNLRDEDAGRSVADITHKVRHDNFIGEITDVIENLNKKQIEAQTTDGRWLEMLMQPYRSSDNVIEGVVVTFKDITRVKEAQLYAESIMNTMVQPLVVLTEDLNVVSANDAFYRIFELKPEHIQNRPIDRMGKWQWDRGEIKSRLKEVISNNKEIDDFKLEREQANGSQENLRLTARRIDRETGSSLILLMVEKADGK